jgi:rhodanese-related sulfurtransferase
MNNLGEHFVKSAHPRLCTVVASAATLFATFIPTARAADGDLGGNRYMYERFYAGDISAARAFLEAVVKNGSWVNPADKLTIVDVRDASEYRRGHPERAVHIPYPRVFQSCKSNPANPSDPVTRTEDGGTCLFGSVPGSSVSMSNEQLFLTFEARFPDKSERVALLCRTGSRSARAANVLANPEKFVGPAYAGRGYKNVLNIWEGFVGQPIAPIHVNTGRVMGLANDVTTVALDGGGTAFGFKASALDLNNDGKLTLKDNDGWRYHQGLPFDTLMLPHLMNQTALPYYEQP